MQAEQEEINKVASLATEYLNTEIGQEMTIPTDFYLQTFSNWSALFWFDAAASDERTASNALVAVTTGTDIIST